MLTFTCCLTTTSRNLNTFPDIGAIPVVESEKVENISAGSIPTKGAASEPDEENLLAGRGVEKSQDESGNASLEDSGPLSPQGLAAELVCKILLSSELRRRLHLRLGRRLNYQKYLVLRWFFNSKSEFFVFFTSKLPWLMWIYLTNYRLYGGSTEL